MRGRVRLGMVGGGQGAFIGGVHRIAARLDDRFELVAGALSSTPEKGRAFPERGIHVIGDKPLTTTRLGSRSERRTDARASGWRLVVRSMLYGRMSFRRC